MNKPFTTDIKVLLPILIVVSITVGLLATINGLTSGIITIISVVALPIVYAILVYPIFGIGVLLLASNLMVLVARTGVNFPLGTILDALQVLLLFSLLLKQRFNPNWRIFDTKITYLILIWVAYNFLEVLNPEALSKLAWLYTIRSIAIITLTYFVFTRFINKIEFIRLIIILWLLLSFLGALYGFKQEFFGFSDSEQTWLNSDPRYSELYFINGHWRKFSFFTDPVTFAYNMAISTILSFTLSTIIQSIKIKLILWALCIFFCFAMLFSGTRGAYILIPAAYLLYITLNFNRKTVIVAVIAGTCMICLIIIPTSNPMLGRFQSAFKPSTDASFMVRKINQKKIQPFIQSHPFGGGLGATGTWGQRFSPNSYLANFPPDSGYVRVAVEQGWVGLLLFCSLIFTTLATGIKNFFRISNPELKNYCLAMTLIIFALNIGNYPQEALVQYPTNIYFYLAISLINVCFLLDKKTKIN
ncbi:O-Antigen ligase [Cnuella takakiae]|uniref:O-Antigen ligase n=1 Tax=Cnuella takakiae TaxID=1302690 RepID=A0A1M5CKK3_9BACT|nr:O-antigen ligase family protein [Cnuella takakiae]OLY91860.1 hypothetical protein BUE76_08070 [Cnuella takakiae]SHF55216.1 O-Antigen ligase [Cnuella takakiae]